MSKIFKMFKKKPKEEGKKPESGDVRQTPAEDPLPLPPVDRALWEAFFVSEPWSRQQYDDYCSHSPAVKYTVAPSYEEYLRLFEERRSIRGGENGRPFPTGLW